jgi:hypothetical protein
VFAETLAADLKLVLQSCFAMIYLTLALLVTAVGGADDPVMVVTSMTAAEAKRALAALETAPDDAPRLALVFHGGAGHATVYESLHIMALAAQIRGEWTYHQHHTWPMVRPSNIIKLSADETTNGAAQRARRERQRSPR